MTSLGSRDMESNLHGWGEWSGGIGEEELFDSSGVLRRNAM